MCVSLCVSLYVCMCVAVFNDTHEAWAHLLGTKAGSIASDESETSSQKSERGNRESDKSERGNRESDKSESGGLKAGKGGWYKQSLNFWESTDATDDGMLQGRSTHTHTRTHTHTHTHHTHTRTHAYMPACRRMRLEPVGAEWCDNMG